MRQEINQPAAVREQQTMKVARTVEDHNPARNTGELFRRHARPHERHLVELPATSASWSIRSNGQPPRRAARTFTLVPGWLRGVDGSQQTTRRIGQRVPTADFVETRVARVVSSANLMFMSRGAALLCRTTTPPSKAGAAQGAQKRSRATGCASRGIRALAAEAVHQPGAAQYFDGKTRWRSNS